MGIDADILGADGWQAALAALDWQVDLGVTEIVGEAPVDRYGLPETLKQTPAVSAPVVRIAMSAPLVERLDAVAVARELAARAGTLAELRAVLEGFELCELKRGAKNTVFADGNPAGRVLVLGEAPGREEDADGLPFVGRAGQLLDRMFAAIGLSRGSPDPASALYVTNVMPWRPPQNRDPEPGEIAMMRPFVERHIELVNPEVIVAMGNVPCVCLLGSKGILRLRGNWAAALGKPVLPMTHPAYLLRTPAAKREAWADLLALKGRLG